MIAPGQKERAVQLLRLHSEPPILVLANAWDAASARVFEQAGFRAIATTSSGVAAALGYPDGEYISRAMLVETVARIARVIAGPLTVDIEAGFGNSIEEKLQTVRAVIEAGAVGINIEDSTKGQEKKLVDTSFQVELLRGVRELASSMDMPLVINARTDVYLLPTGDAGSRFEQAVQRAHAYRQAGADCFFPIGLNDARVIADLVPAASMPVNILANSATPSIPELAQLGVARVSFGSGPMRAALGHLRRVARELLESGTYTSMTEGAISGAELRFL
ncbi:MAG: isocitrate lyase/phosphoenolpyruvate mutase family protein [Chloroflexi bacterium]|nr:MAG: isocitrate lyase/phosphoenolpyruvate mutase family protein [Chloroflexota bacterium]